MNVLIVCEQSGIVRDAFLKRGHNAFSCDLLPNEHENHIQMDAFFAIQHAKHFTGYDSDKWDLIIGHPPCTALAVSGNRWYGTGTTGYKSRVEAMRWTNSLWNTARHDAKSVCFENPVGVLGQSPMGKATQYIQPWMFGHKETKKTGLWLSNLPKLNETSNVKKWLDLMPDKEKHKIWYASPGPDRARLRSLTYLGIADAMAEQWGNHA